MQHSCVFLFKYTTCTFVIPPTDLMGVVVLSDGGELEARTAAAEARRWHTRLTIQTRSAGEDPAKTAAQREGAATLLSKAQGPSSLAGEKLGALTAQLQATALALRRAVADTTASIARRQKGARQQFSTLSQDNVGLRTAIHRFSFGGGMTPPSWRATGSTATLRWQAVTPASAYTPAKTIHDGSQWVTQGGFGFVKEPHSAACDGCNATISVGGQCGGTECGFDTVHADWLSSDGEAFFRIDGLSGGGDYVLTLLSGDWQTFVDVTVTAVSAANAAGDEVESGFSLGQQMRPGQFSYRTIRTSAVNGSIILRLHSGYVDSFWQSTYNVFTTSLFDKGYSWIVNGLVVQSARDFDHYPVTPGAVVALDQSAVIGTSALREWMAVGPFDDANATGLRRKLPAESDYTYSRSFTGKHGKTVRWRRVSVGETGPNSWNTESSPVLDVAGGILGGADTNGSAVVLLTYIKNDAYTQAVLVGSASGAASVSIDGREVAVDKYLGGLLDRELRIEFAVQPNRWIPIAVKLLNHAGDKWEAWFGVQTQGEAPIPTLQVSACGGQPSALCQ